MSDGKLVFVTIFVLPSANTSYIPSFNTSIKPTICYSHCKCISRVWATSHICITNYTISRTIAIKIIYYCS